ncbi:MAG: molecular chaperone DnaK [Actinobacteria bacterium]|nr:MAG: molecular chaperone DnaK [Actinomycetota bacterium]
MPSKKPAAKAAKKAPAKKVAPVKVAPVKKAPAKKAPAKKVAPVKKAPVKKAPVKKAPVKKAPVKKAPVKKAPVKKELPAKKILSPSDSEKTSAKSESELPHGIVAPRLVMLPSAKPAKKKGGTTLKPLKGAPEPLVVSEGEGPWTKSELKDFKQELERELVRLREELSAAEVEINDLLRDSGDGAGDDQADAGTKTFEREHELSLLNNNRDMVVQCERALARITDGTYGVCELCGNPIGKARLQAFPRATMCMVCKQREERR